MNYKTRQGLRVSYLAILLNLICLSNLFAQESVEIWGNKVPGAILAEDYKQIENKNDTGVVTGISKVVTPELKIFLTENPGKNASILILPGGGYSHLSVEKEGRKVAKWANSLGLNAFVLHYRLPSDEIMEDKSLAPLADAQQAMRLIRNKAKDWNLNPDQIGVLGFSAGGHLAASLSTRFEEKIASEDQGISARPDFSILIYPVISMMNEFTHKGSQESLLGKNADEDLLRKFSNEYLVSAQTPPSFLVHATDDKAVPVENSLEYYKALKENNVPVEMHVFEDGGHGFGLGQKGTNSFWPKNLEKWLDQHGLIKKEPMVFSYFTGNGEDGLHLAYSYDAYTWKALNNGESFLKPELGKEKLMRDPCIIKGGDGKYHMVWTVGWTEKGIGYASSDDLINWSEQQYIPVMEHEENARNTWAPEVTYDEENDEYVIYWATTIKGKFPETQIDADDGYNHRMYYVSTKDFENFSDTKILYEPGFNVIDASIKKYKDQFVMFLKDETRKPAEKNIRIATAKNLKGPYSEASEPITGDYWAEGPTSVKIGDDYFVFFDKYTEKEFGAVRSHDLENWEDISDKVSFPEDIRHGSILKVPEEVLKKLMQQ
ncbi:alpha/beta hydrolase fold domain-containing protein [Salegentibacter sp. LM13S]|uniref:alpha/beta hydrolase fold domain-containing protein n=1 Tax=Salegentibacter lacus TaxID=2873599 RepID=UPI001CCE9E93|nr:alpha/beta hydrolase fold domain-containing protein [Salegentibacter lacus]MBZ9630057.1 alpha/beta hydrolase fold domain-containing protein [Salegentibacter lacus]